MAKKHYSEITLHDRLSRLAFTQACKLLGFEGRKLIQEGGAIEITDINAQAKLTEKEFTLKIEDATASITLDQFRQNQLLLNCSECSSFCVHLGAALSLILEEKTLLGLAIPPKERVPIESMSESELISFELNKRLERAKKEKMNVKSKSEKTLWSDYVVTNSESGKSYRVALRGWEYGESFCTCSDFKKNTLGTCKHILNVISKVKKKFTDAEKKKPYIRTNFSIYLHFGKSVSLRLGVPSKLKPNILELIKNYRGDHIENVSGLIQLIKKLEIENYPVNIYPDASEYIEITLSRDHLVKLSKEIRADPKRHPLRTSLLKVELLPHQLDGIAFALGASRAILADDMGLGKTIQGIGLAELLANTLGIKRVLIVCPTSVKSQWQSEIHKFCHRDVQVVVGAYQDRTKQYQSDCFFTICNYEQIVRDLMFVKNLTWDLIIIDEAQRIKNWEAKTSQEIKSLHSRFALALTGTPIENRLDDLFSIAEFIDNRHLGPAFRFFNIHKVSDEKGKVLGYKNLDQLRNRLQSVLLRRTRGMVMKDLPSRVDQIIRIPATKEQEVFNTIQMQIVQSIITKRFISEMDLLRLQKALLLARMNANSTYLISKSQPSYSSKIEKINELFDQIKQEPDRKCIIFSEWTTMLDLIEVQLNKRKMGFVRLDGQVPQKKRQQIVDEFKNNEKCIFFITTNAGSTGLNLQVANTIINVDLPWNPAVLEQRIARAHRMGQKNKIQVYIMVSTKTIEEKMLTTLASKKMLALAALDFNSKVNEVSITSGIDELKNRLEELLGAETEAANDVDSLKESEKVASENKEKFALASGTLLSSVFDMMGSLVPQNENEQTKKAQADIFQKLQGLVELDKNGNFSLKITLPNQNTIVNMSRVLAGFATTS